VAEQRNPSLIPLSQDHHHGLAWRCVAASRLGQPADGLKGLGAISGVARFLPTICSHFRAEEEALFPVGDWYRKAKHHQTAHPGSPAGRHVPQLEGEVGWGSWFSI
jgi:hypothetical protein